MAEVKLDFLGDLRRTHTCGGLRTTDVGKTAILMGWVHRRRDLGGVIFIHLRDRDGITQIVFDESKNSAVHQRAQELGTEYVIAVEGLVTSRTPDTVNPNISTGDVEVAATRIWVLNESRTPPFPHCSAHSLPRLRRRLSRRTSSTSRSRSWSASRPAAPRTSSHAWSPTR